MLQRLIGERIEILVDVAAEAAWVKADPSQIEQVLMNLLVNARDAMPEGGVLTLAVRETEVTASDAEAGGEVPPGSYVAMTVRDTGVGMDEATRRQIFEPFFTTKEAGRGTGLGLPTVYGIVQQSGGFVTVDSEPGRGSVFEVYLPREAAAAAQAEPAAAPTGPGRDESVLVVEDDPALRRLVEAILLGAGYRVVSAATGDEALALLERSAGLPDLLFTDVVLPGMSGHDLARRVSERGPGVKVLFTSGYTDDADLREEVLEGRTSFLAKPYTPSSLARAVREALDEP
jgi:CheY-like chemotaxis protein